MMFPAHGIGGAKDLPIPSELAILGGGAALTVSFVVLALAWRTPRFDAATQGRPPPPWLGRLMDATAIPIALRVLGLLCFGYVTWAAVAGQDLLTNPVFGVVYVLLWVGIVPASVLFGSFYRAVSPVRSLHLGLARLLRLAPDEGLLVLPSRVGYWPAVVGLFAFVWLELVYPSATYLGPLRLWFALYLAIGIVGALLYGGRWLAAADPFEVYSTLVGHLSVFSRRATTVRDETGRTVHRDEPVLQSPLQHLDGLRPRPGLVAVVAVLLGSTAFDTFKDSSTWVSYIQGLDTNTELVNTLALLGFCGAVAASFTAATAAVRPRPGLGLTRRDMPGQFAHALVPILVGYIAAHYLTYFVEVGQQTLVLLSDPLGTGANLLGTGDWTVSYWLSDHPTLLASLKVCFVVGGHVLGAVSSHDRALKVLPKDAGVRGQLPVLVLMVAYTCTGLYLLFGA